MSKSKVSSGTLLVRCHRCVRAIDWFVLQEGRYDRLVADESGVFRSRIFPGLWLNSQALLSGDLGQVLGTLESGCATPEHATFANKNRSAGR